MQAMKVGFSVRLKKNVLEVFIFIRWLTFNSFYLKTPDLSTFMASKPKSFIMKHLFLLLITTTCLLVACNNNKKPGEITVTSEDGKTTAKIQPGDLAQAADAIQKKTEELLKLSPYTLDQMKALLPEELAGAKRSKFSANSAMGAAFAEGEYSVNDSTGLELKIFDCAGQAGAGIYSMQYLAMMNFQSESDEEYTKSIDFKGGKAVEHLDKRSNRATLTYVAADRLVVTLEGKNTGIDLLKQAAGSLNLK